MRVRDDELTQGPLGAHNELIAAAWLLRNGYQVFRNIAAVGPIDLVGVKDGKTEFFDAKTAYRSESSGELVHPKLSVDQIALGVKCICVLSDGSCEISTRSMLPGKCEECGIEFARVRQWGRRRFCSQLCSSKNYQKCKRNAHSGLPLLIDPE